MPYDVDAPRRKYEADFFLKEGNTSPAIEAQLLDNDENPVDLNGATVRFVMRKTGSGTNKVDSSATISDPDNGIVQYGWSDGDTDEVGTYNAEWEVDYSGGTGSNFDADEDFPNEGYITVRIDESL